MMNKVVETGKKLVEKAVKARRWLMCAGMCAIVEMNSAICYADTATSNDITKGISNLSTVITTIIAGIGGIFVAKNGYEFAASYQSNDSSGMSSAVKGMVGGLMMISIKAILKIIGIKE